MPNLSPQVIDSLSKDRFQTYLAATNFDAAHAAALYIWNARVGAAFHLPLQGVEVSLRNDLNRRLIKLHGEHWWRQPDFRRNAHRRTMMQISAATQGLRKRHRPETNPNMVSAMSFGFWTTLLRSPHPSLNAAHQSIVALDSQAAHVAALRNRIAHHEPIFRRDLLADYGIAMRLLHAICPATHDWIRPHCRVPSLVRQKP
jgi:hypothetical protein